MITIKSFNTEVKKQENGIMSANFASESVYIKFRDGVEVTIPCGEDANKMNKILTMFRNSKSENILLDLTNRESPISFL